LARVLASGGLRVNVPSDSPPWSSLDDSGRPNGFDVQVARRIGARLGVDVEFTSFPMDEVLSGAWDDRWDVAMGHLVAGDERTQTLQLTQPYAWDQLRIAVADSSGLAPEDMAGRGLCVAIGSPAQGWLDGALQLTALDGSPALPPAGAQAVPSPTDADCRDALAAGTVEAWLGSGPAILAAQEGDPSLLASDPLAVAPVVIATGSAGSPDTSLEQAVDDVITTLLGQGALSRPSQRFLGDDYTVPPSGQGVPAASPSPLPSGEGLSRDALPQAPTLAVAPPIVPATSSGGL
jgi:ABC-type amino acid transport substrate-binding protein